MLAVGNVDLFAHGETGGSGWIRLDLHHIPERQQLWIPGDANNGDAPKMGT